MVAIKGEPATAGGTPGTPITLERNLDSMIRNLHDPTFTLTRNGRTSQADDVTLVLTDAPGSSAVTGSERCQTLSFGMGDDTVTFTVPTFWIRNNFAGHFDTTVEAGPEYDVSGANVRMEAVTPTSTFIEVTLENTSYEVTEGYRLTTIAGFNFVQDFGAPNRDVALLAVSTVTQTAENPDDYGALSDALKIPVGSWYLVANRYVARVPVKLVTFDDALYKRSMGAHDGLEIELRNSLGTPNWVETIGPSAGEDSDTVRYPVTIIYNETLSIVATLSSPGLTASSNLAIAEDAGNAVTLQVSSTDTASNGQPVTLPDDVKLKITPQPGDATESVDWNIDVEEIALDGVATITIVDDTNVEHTERVTFAVGLEDDPTFQSARATLRITDDDFTGPALVSAEVDGSIVTLEYNKTLDTSSRPTAGSFNVRVGAQG